MATNGATKIADPGVATIIVPTQDTANVVIPIRGRKPIIINRMSEKAKHDLLIGGQRKTAAERVMTLKHVPHTEFLASAYTMPFEDDPTYLAGLGAWFK